MANGIPLIKNRLKSQLTCACVYLDLDGATAGTSTGTHSESAPPEQPEPIVSDVSSAEAHPSGRVLRMLFWSHNSKSLGPSEKLAVT